MNAKRLTALALAALMAASTTSVALAAPGTVDKDQVLNFYAGAIGDDLYMMDEDGYIKAANYDDFAPGDTVYIALMQEDSASKKDFDRMDVYGDWQIGKDWVKDIDIVYKKGQWKTDVAKKVNYTFVNLPGALSKYEGSTFETNSTEASAILAAARAKLKELINNDSKPMEDYTQVQGMSDAYVIGDKVYTSKQNALTALNLTEHSEYYEYNGVQKLSLDKLGLSVNNAEDFIVDGKYMTKAQLNALIAEKGFKPIADEIGADGTNKVWAEVSSLGNSGTLNIGPSSTDKYKNEISSYDNIYVVGRKTGDQYTHYDYINVTALTDNGVIGKLSLQSVVQASADGKYHDSTGTKYDIDATALKKSRTAYFEGDTFKGTNLDTLGIKEASSVSANMYVESTDSNGKAMVNKDTVKSDRLAAADKITASNFNAVTTYANNPTGSYDGYTTDSGYAYWVQIKTKSSTGTKDIDVVGDLSIGRSKNSAKENKISVDFTLTNQTNDSHDKGEYEDAEDFVHIEPDTRAVVKFADDASDEFEVEFGDDDARFIFNARGQGKLNLAYNTKYDKDFAYDYDDANIDFLTFEGEPTTNRTGTLYIYADEDSYIYEVTPRGAKKINGAKYNHDEEAWEIRTRHLTSYAISDKKLKTVDQMENSSSSNSSNKPGNNKPGSNKPGNNNDKPNPDTGR